MLNSIRRTGALLAMAALICTAAASAQTAPKIKRMVTMMRPQS